MFSHSAEEHYILQHGITNITVINNSKRHEPLLRAPLKAQSDFGLFNSNASNILT